MAQAAHCFIMSGIFRLSASSFYMQFHRMMRATLCIVHSAHCVLSTALCWVDFSRHIDSQDIFRFEVPSVRLNRLKQRFLASYSSVDNWICRHVLII